MTKSGSSPQTNRTKKTQDNQPPVPTGAKVPFGIATLSGMENEIRTRAYQLYEQEGWQQGRDLEYWFRAEADVLARRGRKPN
jgi:hypothetical protein